MAEHHSRGPLRRAWRGSELSAGTGRRYRRITEEKDL